MKIGMTRIKPFSTSEGGHFYTGTKNAKGPVMEWPNRFLLVVLSLGTVAIVAPWLIPRVRLASLIRLSPALAATLCWVNYELYLRSLFRAGDPLIRVDLLVIAPIIAIAWMSAAASIAVRRLRGERSKQPPK